MSSAIQAVRGTIVAMDVPLSLPTSTPVTTHTVRARRLALKDTKGSEYKLRNNPVWYLAVDGSDALYSYTQRAGKEYIVKIVINKAKTAGVVSEVAEIRSKGGAADIRSGSSSESLIKGLEVNREGTAIYYLTDKHAYAYLYE